jgi:hypothetical protein
MSAYDDEQTGSGSHDYEGVRDGEYLKYLHMLRSWLEGSKHTIFQVEHQVESMDTADEFHAKIVKGIHDTFADKEKFTFLLQQLELVIECGGKKYVRLKLRGG